MCHKICPFLARKRNVPLRRKKIPFLFAKICEIDSGKLSNKRLRWNENQQKILNLLMIDLFKHIFQKISLTILLKTGFFSFLSTASPSISSSLSRSSAGCCPGFRSVLASIWLGFFSSNAAEKITKYEKHTIWVRYFHEKSNSKILWTSCKSYLLKFIYSEKATEFWETFTLPLTGTT